MARSSKACFPFIFILFLLFVKIVFPTEYIVIEFLQWDPSKDPRWCADCEPWLHAYENFLRKNETMERIQNDYADKVLVNWIEYFSPEGQVRKQLYDITVPNSIVVKNGKGNVTIIEENFNETYIREVVDAYLEGVPAPAPSFMPLIAVLTLAFSFGFFETFSPCLIAMLSFVISYTIGKVSRFREGVSQIMVFGAGFVSAAVLLGLTLTQMFLYIPSLQNTLTWATCIFAIFFGLDLLGIRFFKFLGIKFETKPIIKKLSRKYVFTYTGLVLLGFIFFFLDPCITPIFVSMLPLLLPEYLPLVMLVFCLGVITPFICAGILAGCISKLARSTYRFKSKIQAISGLIVLAYAIFIIIFHLIL